VNPGQGSGEGIAVGFQPFAEELQQPGKLDGVCGIRAHKALP